jgi:hypothetical protein
MSSKNIIDDDDFDPDLQQPLIEFSTTSYAVLEREQRVDLKVKRKGPIDVDVRFRCLFFTSTFTRSCMCLC